MNIHLNPPESNTPGYVVFSGVMGALFAALCIVIGRVDYLCGTLLLLFACGIPMWWLEMRRFPASHLCLDSIPVWRKKIRFIGMLIVWMLFCGIYFLVTYSLAALSKSDILGDMQLVLIAASIPWSLWMLYRRARGNQFDSLEMLGSAAISCIFKRRKIKKKYSQIFLGWCVKAYFFPLMLGGCYFFVSAASKVSLEITEFSWISIVAFLIYLLYAIDTAFGTIGYCSTSRRINGQIRSTDSTISGWGVTLVCYPPFNLIVLHQWLAYKDGYEWHEWLTDKPLLLFVWGTVVLLLTVGYVWSTVSFGLRFSNLSYRGLVSSGPYRYFKHPSYFFKNISWWLISIPFISLESGRLAIINCLGLIGINCIYILRAWTEERHLASDPDYKAYSIWMAKNGVLGRFRQLIGC